MSQDLKIAISAILLFGGTITLFCWLDKLEEERNDQIVLEQESAESLGKSRYHILKRLESRKLTEKQQDVVEFWKKHDN